MEEEEEEAGDEGAAKEEGEEGDAGALYGSHGPKFGGGCEFLYTQFELHSPVARKHQITLLKVPWDPYHTTYDTQYVMYMWWCDCIGLHAPDCRDVQQGV